MLLRHTLETGMESAVSALALVAAICLTYLYALKDAYGTWSAAAFSSPVYRAIAVRLLVG